jgi:hypothetical protein
VNARTFVGQVVRRLLFTACRVLQAAAGDHPVPLSRIRRIRSLAPVTNALVPPVGRGRWALDDDALAFIVGEVERRRPSWVLEFGSGRTTVRLAEVMADITPGNGVVVLSIEQHPEFVERTTHLLRDAGLGDRVRLTCRQLRRHVVAGRETLCYDLSPEFTQEFVPRDGPGLILVDGPAGGGDVRFGTIPLIQPCLPGRTPFFLDDALRDDELRVADAWAQLPGFAVRGIHVVGEGLLVGSVDATTSS